MEPSTSQSPAPQPTKEAYEKVFNLFIAGDDDLRPDLCRPFKQDGFYYATDAYSLIFLPVQGTDLPFQEQYKPCPAKIIPKEPNCNIEINVADLERQLLPDMIDEMEDCTECEGKGERDCDMGHTHDCPNCDGTGEKKTSTDKKIEDPTKMFVLDGIGFQYWQLRRLIDACKLLGVETITKTNGDGLNVNLFKCGAAGVLVMPCHVDESGEEDVKPVIINIG